MKIKELGKKAIAKKNARSGLILIIAAAIAMEAISLTQVYFSQQGIRKEAKARAESQLEAMRNNIMDIINQTEAAVRNNIWIAQWALDTPDSLHRIPELMVRNNPVVAGSTIAIVPGYYKDKPLYSPYIMRTDSGLLLKSLATEQYNYPEQEWFIQPVEQERGYWSEPYIDDGGGDILMTTYSMPIRDSKGKIAAVLTADLDLDWLTKLVGNVKVYPSAFSTMISRKGKIMVSPAETLVMKKTVNEFAATSDDSSSLNRLNKAMLAGESGNLTVTYEGRKTLVYFAPIQRTGWAMNIFIPENEIFEGLRQVNGLVKILQFIGLLVIFLVLRSVAKSQIRYRDISEKKDKMENELMIARNIQMSMIPKTFPPFPERHDLDIAAAIIPAKEVSGDLYDFFIRDNKLFFCIGDVSGKGVPAALVMAVTRSLFRSVSGHEDSPGTIVTAMNNSMTDMNESNMFVTFLCCVLDLRNGQLNYCNAGHNGPLIFTDKIAELNVVPNLPLGIIKDFSYKEQQTKLHYDDALFLYTDGLTEAENSIHQLFGLQRLKNALSGRKGAYQHLKNVQAAISDFVQDAPQSDDLTMLFFHYLGDNTATTTTSEISAPVKFKEQIHCLNLVNDIRQIDRLHSFIEAIAEEKKLPSSLATCINLAIEEALSNVIQYAYMDENGRQKEKQPVNLSAALKEDEIEFTISDKGKPFDPTAAKPADTTLKAEDREIGGLGIHLYKNIMDTVRYQRTDGWNILTLTKKLPPKTASEG